MMKHKIAVIYDASYLMGDGEAVKKLILSLRFSSIEKPGLLGSLLAKVVGKGAGSHKTVIHEAEEVFVVSEIVPSEIMKQVDRDSANRDKGQRRAAGLLSGGAAKVDLCMDTVVSDSMHAGQHSSNRAEDPAEVDRQTTDMLMRYAIRVVSHRTSERYDLAVVATEDGGLLQTIAEQGRGGKAVFGVDSKLLTGPRGDFHDKLTELANLDNGTKMKLEI